LQGGGNVYCRSQVAFGVGLSLDPRYQTGVQTNG
jgi:hypothetical protein